VAHWKNCRMDTLWYTDEADTNEPCEVRIEAGYIEVTYKRDGGVAYKGSDDGCGHFELHANLYNGHATLHMFPGSSVLEGSWVEAVPSRAPERGMWRIILA
jgi:hypothetical protein